MSISAVILTKDEEDKIERCLKSVFFCDEIIVIDDNSIDRTPVIANKLGAAVISRDLNKDFSAQRNFGMDKAVSEWVLFVDADEVVSNELADEIKKAVGHQSFVGYFLKRKDVFFGKELKYGETDDVRLLRLAKKSEKNVWRRTIHETWQVGGSISTLQNPLLHYSHTTLSDFISDINEYSTLHAKANYDEGKKSNLLKIIFLPKFKFFRNYILKRGYLDGIYGITFALFMSLHSFLAWSKLWLLQKNLKTFKY